MLVRFVFVSILCILSTFGLWADESMPINGNVLVISSYSPLRENGNRLIESFIKDLNSEVKTKISVEYMNCEATSEFDSWAIWMKQLFNAYKVKPDIVVLLGAEAWSTYRSTCVEEWHQVPIVLGFVRKEFNDFERGDSLQIQHIEELSPIADTFDHFKVTGYYYNDYFKENLELIKKLQPDVHYVAFWYDNRYSLGYYYNNLLSAFAEVDDLDLCYLSGDKLSTAQLLDTIAKTDDNHALLSAGWYTDVNKYPHAYSMLQNELSRYTSKFMYQLQDQNHANMNCIGGYYVSGADLGGDIASLASDLLKHGFKTSSFRKTPSSPHYYINFPVLSTAGINEQLLPDQVSFYNIEPSLVEEYPLTVALFSFILFSMLVLIFAVLYYRRRKEKNYEATNLRMMQLLESMPDMAVVYDCDQRIIDIVNPQENVLLHLRVEDLIGVNMRDVVMQNDAFLKAGKLITKNVIHTGRTKEILVFEYEVPYKNKIYYAKARTVPYGDKGVICFAHDITPHVMAEKEVLDLKAFLQSIVDNLPIGLAVKDVSNDFKYVFYNNKAGDFYGDKPKSLIGKNDFEVNDPLAEQFREEDMAVCESSCPLVFARENYDENGKTVRWGIASKTHLVKEDGTSYIITVLLDTTEIRKKEMELEESKFELELAFDIAQIVLTEFNVNTYMFSSPNPAIYESRGVLFQDFKALMHPDDATLLELELTNVVEGRNNVINLQVRITFPGEEQRWYDMHAAVYERDRDGKVSRIISLRRDITALKMTDELIELRNKAEESNRLKSAFLANMSHEIRTPLNVIVGFSNLIMETDDREEISEFCRIIETNNTLLLQLINDILDLSRIEAGQLDFVYSDVNVSEIFITLEQMFRSRVKEGVMLCCDIPASPSVIRSEKNRLTQVLTNFLTNACKFTSQGKIRMGYEVKGDILYLYVEDTGKGIAPANIPFVFNRFSKFDSFVQGTGLGLSICESIVQNLNGEIGVESELGKGSVFWITLPL